MKPRSPVLGYNHNVRYAQRLWHVQTEDSGVHNPHIFTHLFHDGTILATKRLDYDPTSDVGVVQKLMQAQHKAMLRDLKQGAFDDKIARFFGQPVVRERGDQTEKTSTRDMTSGEFDAEPRTDPSIPPEVSAEAVRLSAELNKAKTDPSRPPVMAPPAPVLPGTRAAPASPTRPVPLTPSRPNLTPSRPSVPVAASRSPSVAPPPARPPVSGVGGRRPAPPTAGAAHSYGGGKPTAEGVVVARPAVIVGGEVGGGTPRSPMSVPRQARHTPPPPGPAPPPQPPSKTPTTDNIFGGDLISEKSLDEVILAYLSEDLNDK
jgi:hypothetical protein